MKARLLVCLAICAATVTVANAHAAPCQPEGEPESSISTAGWCVRGVATPEDQDAALWTLDAADAGLWILKLDALPGQGGKALIAMRADGADQPLWSGDLSPSADALESPPLFLTAGSYAVYVAAAGRPLVYRLRLEPGPTLPARFDAGRDLAESFTGLVSGNGAELVFPWRLSAASPALWTFTAQAAPKEEVTLSLADEVGNTVLSSANPDGAGVVRLPDLKLAPGTYRLSLAWLGEGAPAVMSAVAQEQPAGFASEPDADVARAHPLVLGQNASGRLATGGLYDDHDLFALTVPAKRGARLVDLTLSGPSGASLTLALVGQDGSALVEREAAGEVLLRGLSLAPGEHLLRVAGLLDHAAAYTLLAEEAGAPPASEETEPNGVAAAAMPIPPSGTVSGSFDGDDAEFFDLGVTRGLQLWNIEAVGEGVTGLTHYYDGRGNAVSTRPINGDAPFLRLTRLLLPPGRNLLRLDGTGARWLLRARPLGPPVPGEEIEPNDDELNANTLAFSQPVTGWLDHPEDRDLYAFHLTAEQHLRVALSGPADLPLGMSIHWGGYGNRYAEGGTTGADGAGQSAPWDGLLPPGDYILEVSAGAQTSRDPYRLVVEPAGYFQRPADLEPNDDVWQARPVPPDGRVKGRLHSNNSDWYRLPDGLVQGALKVTASQVPAGGFRVMLARDLPEGRERLEEMSLFTAGESASLSLPGGDRLVLGVVGTPGDYGLAVDFGKASVPIDGPLDLQADLAVDAGVVAAYHPRAQRVAGRLSVRNSGAAPLDIEIDSWISDERWRVIGLPPTMALAVGGMATLPVTIEVAEDTRDERPVKVEVAFRQGTAAPVVAEAVIEPALLAPAVAPQPLAPGPMIGGLNVAWTALGATTDPASAGLIDGIIDMNGIALGRDVQPIVDLAGDRPVPITGVILQASAGVTPANRLADFAVEVSEDGEAFSPVLRARLSPAAREQAFPFPATRLARAVRLVPLSAHGGPSVDSFALAEFKVVADPAFKLGEGFDLGERALGGHVVRTVGLGGQTLNGEAAAWPGGEPVAFPEDRNGGAEWVMAFYMDRAARIARLVWHERPDTPPEEHMHEVEVAASEHGPLGPWVQIGRWRLDGDSQPPVLVPNVPVWARALSFRVVEPAAGRVTLPERIEIVEASDGPSILGEWGDMSPPGPYEAALPPTRTEEAFPPVGHDAPTATPLSPGALARGSVQRGKSEDWYDLELPEGARFVRANFADGLPADVSLTLVDAAGKETEMAPNSEVPGELGAAVAPGAWKLRVWQPPQSVIVAWDTSISVSPFFSAIMRVVQQLSWQLEPGREEINLVPFRGEGSAPILDEWSGDPAAVYGVLHAYPWLDTNSNAEAALLVSAEALLQRVGTRAIIVITDASFSGSFKIEPLWNALANGRTRIFALHLPLDPNPSNAMAQANLMLDWASAAGGFYARFASQGEGEAVFRRVSAWLGRPASYAFTLAIDTKPPDPGRLIVRLDESAAAGAGGGAPATLEIILDASGSMLAKLEGRARIDVARQVLRELGTKTLPAGLPIGLRVFGHREGAPCASNLVLPITPLRPDTFTQAVDGVEVKDRARTAIAEALRQAGVDLAGVAGPRRVLLITDGEETCGGDPQAEIDLLKKEGVELRLDIVGFAVDDPTLRKTFEDWASAGGGAYFDAGNEAALRTAVGQATALPVTIFGLNGAEQARGFADGTAIELPPGQYRVRVGTTGDDHPVEIKSQETSVLEIARP